MCAEWVPGDSSSITSVAEGEENTDSDRGEPAHPDGAADNASADADGHAWSLQDLAAVEADGGEDAPILQQAGDGDKELHVLQDSQVITVGGQDEADQAANGTDG